MYGTRDAPAIWQAHHTKRRSNGSVFCQGTLGDQDALQRLNILKTANELKWLGTLGHEVCDDKEVHFLNRLIRCGVHQGSSVIFLEPDRRHVDLLVQQLGMASAKGVETPDVKKSVDETMEANSPLLRKDMASMYRSCVMRAAYLSQDRPDLSHAVKNLSRKMVAPTEASLQDLKRLCIFGQEA